MTQVNPRDVVDVGVSVCAARRFVGSVENVHASAAMKHIRSYLLLTTILAWFGKGTMFSVSEENTESAVALYCIVLRRTPGLSFPRLPSLGNCSQSVKFHFAES